MPDPVDQDDERPVPPVVIQGIDHLSLDSASNAAAAEELKALDADPSKIFFLADRSNLCRPYINYLFSLCELVQPVGSLRN